jgi:Domain of unknown function (DUF4157)
MFAPPIKTAKPTTASPTPPKHGPEPPQRTGRAAAGLQTQEGDHGPRAISEVAPAVACDFTGIPLAAPGLASRSGLPRLQRKLAIGQVDDPLEHEADRIAEQVMRMSSPEVSNMAARPQISPKHAASEATGRCQREPAVSSEGISPDAPGIVHDVLRTPGQPLSAASLAYFEPRLGHDFSGVRLRCDAQAARSARAVNARAYTAGRHIVFAAGACRATTEEGRKLLAHELTHTVQQSAHRFVSTSSGATALQRSPDDDPVRASVRPVSPEDMVRIVLDQRHWGAGKPARRGAPGIPDAALTMEARGTPAGLGFETNAAIQILDAEGNQVAFEMAKFGSGSSLHAEPQALSRLQVRLAGVDVAGGRMIVAVDQYACADCVARLRYFARQAGLSGFEVWVPARGEVTPKTAARTAATRPAKMDPAATTPSYRVEARLVQGESFVPRTGKPAAGWSPPLTETLLNLGKKTRAVKSAQKAWSKTLANLGRTRLAAPVVEPRRAPAVPITTREVAIEPSTGGARGAGPTGARSSGGGTSARGGGAVRGGRSGGFGFGAVALEIMYPERAKEAKAQAKAAEIADKLARYDKQINERVNRMKPDIAKLQLHKNANEKVYMNVVYEVHHFEFSVDVYLKSVEVTTRNLNQKRRYSTVRIEKGWATGKEYNVRRDVDEHTYSLEVAVYSEAELEHFANLSDEYLKYQRALAIRPDDRTTAEQLTKLRQEIADTFGPDVWMLGR